jgi:tetratricopeptide (TPR) repeat protein
VQVTTIPFQNRKNLAAAACRRAALPWRAAPVVAALLLGAGTAVAAEPMATAKPRVASQDANRDVVQLKSGATELGKIKSEDFSGIDIDPVKGEAKRIAWGDVAPNGVTYGTPAEWLSIQDLLNANKFEEALPQLDELKADAKLRAPVKQNVLYYIGVAKQRLGKQDEALAAYKELLAGFPKSRYLMEVGEATVAIHTAKKDLAGAVKALEQISNDATTAGVDASFATAVNVLKGRVFEEQKDYPKAKAAYGVASKASGIPLNVQLQAELGEARTSVALNQKPDAEAAYRKILTRDGPNPIMAGAWNGLGDLALERGKAANGGKGDPEQILDALYMYLRGVAQYPALPGQPTQEYERALAGAATSFKYLSELEKVADRKKQYQERSQQRAQQLRKEFPNSIYLTGL